MAGPRGVGGSKSAKQLRWLSRLGLVVLVIAALLIGAVPATATGTRTSPHARVAPAAPLITTVSGEGLGILAAWTPASGAEVITSYTLKASAISVKGVKVARSCASPAPTTAPGTDTTAVVTHVCANVAYGVTMTATGPTGTSAASLRSNPVVPLGATVPAVPVVTNVFGRDHSLVVSWSSPAYDGGKPIRGYEVRATAGKSTVSTKTGPDVSSARVDKLKNGVAYSVSVVALNGVGASPAATSSGVPAPPHAPGVPEDLSEQRQLRKQVRLDILVGVHWPEAIQSKDKAARLNTRQRR
jgi:hypothetical protein